MAGSPMPELPQAYLVDIRVQDAMRRMRNGPFLRSVKYQEQQTWANVLGAHPHIVEFTRKFVKRMASLNIPVFAHCIVRTYDEQLGAYVRGASKDSPADGLWPHMGLAVDIIHCRMAWFESQPHAKDMWAVWGHIGKEVAHSMDIDIEWGGDWAKFLDAAHFQLRNWKEIALNGDCFWHPLEHEPGVDRQRRSSPHPLLHGSQSKP